MLRGAEMGASGLQCDAINFWRTEIQERQSSSGVVIATGTGATGWARSISRQRDAMLELPDPTDRVLAFFVREPFPSVSTGTELEGIEPWPR